MKLIKYSFFLMIGLLASSCFQSEYEKLAKYELSREVRYDSLLLGISFGNTSKQFFKRCWTLNKDGIISHGPKNMFVKYMIKDSDSSSSDIMTLFYPAYDKDDKINKMDMEFSYVGWAPWNERYFSDKLLPVVIDTLENWYGGNSFIKVEFDKKPKEVWVKLDGNRRISVNASKNNAVIVKIKDLLNADNK